MGKTCARLLAALVSLAPLAAAADEVDLTGKIAIELNAVIEAEYNCTLTFVVHNGFAVDIGQLVFEAELFDVSGAVDRLPLFNFGALPVGRPRVRQFAVPDLSCSGLSRVLFNGLHTCAADGLDTEVCASGMVPSSRVAIEVLG